jgi:hypothetical protein
MLDTLACPPKSTQTAEPLPRRSAGLQDRGRATLLWGLAILVLSQLGLRLGIDHCWPQLRDPGFEARAQRLEQLLGTSPERPITVVMVGSSVTWNLFKAKYLEDTLSRQLNREAVVMNLGQFGAGPLTQLVWTRRLIERGIRPDLVLVEITPFQYYTPGAPVDAGRFPAHLLTARDLDVLERYGNDPELRNDWWRYRWCPAYAHRLMILSRLSEPLLPIEDRPAIVASEDGRFWWASESTSPDVHRATLAIVAKSFKQRLEGFTPGKPSLEALEELLAVLKQEGIPAALVLAPEGPTVRNLYPPDRLAAFVQHATRLSARYDCRFVDAFDWLDDEMFEDSVHANLAGAAQFSNRLAQEVLLPALTGSDGQLSSSHKSR